MLSLIEEDAMLRNGVVPFPPASTGVFLDDGKQSLAIRTTIAFARRNGIIGSDPRRHAVRPEL